MTRLQSFFGSLTGRIFFLLLVGTGAAAVLSLSIADLRQRADIAAFQNERTADRVQAYVNLRQRIGASEARALAARGATSVRVPPPEAIALTPDQALNRLLADGRLGAVEARASRVSPEACQRPEPGWPDRDSRAKAAVVSRAASLGLGPPSCWLVDLGSAQGRERIAVWAPPQAVRPRLLDPGFVLALALAAALLSLVVARTATRPVRHMAAGALALGESLDAPPMPETGPVEVRRAAHAMNSLQSRLKASIAAKSQILAAVTHDIQTPMTRMRLRLEKVEDTELRQRLLDDLAAMQALAREGLEIARDTPSTEPLAVVALDSLIKALADDERDAGHDVVFLQGCDCDVQARPQELRRCLANLIDNALRYAGNARIGTVEHAHHVEVQIDDSGPGIPEDQLVAVMEPFVRLETSRSRDTGGSGLGLAIAARLARDMNGELTLVNRPEGGVRASLRLPRSGGSPAGF
ncbi:sensor histidine kinase [Brevundimonas sp. SL130]|uniref:sensor histidine kinase n=1 Tax=Brevundimonas sp. SL130 TaxID=2995143 RepID=UPI00226C9474|nr:ATP-binding protein [Brevundimonas sp. SL130]WAC59017.1 ATP-binding protein [Brevundimonas sp. SL130]